MIWSTIQFTFQLVEDTQAIFDLLFQFFEEIALELAIVQTEINTFQNSLLVSSVAKEVFAVLLEFWVYAVKTYRSIRFGTLKTYSIRARFEKLEASLHKKLLGLKHAAEAQHHQDSQSFWNEFKDNRSGNLPFSSPLFRRFSRHTLTEPQDQIEQEVLDWLRATDLKKADSKRYDGTCSWIRSKPEYKTWSQPSSKARLMVVFGIPGAGKEILSSFLVEDARGRLSEPVVSGVPADLTLYHLFKADDENKNSPLAALRSLLDQFYRWIVETDDHHQPRAVLQAATRKRHVDYKELFAYFLGLAQQITTCNLTIILDALDECLGIKAFCRDLKFVATPPMFGLSQQAGAPGIMSM